MYINVDIYSTYILYIYIYTVGAKSMARDYTADDIMPI